ncbi:MFS transporter [Chryseolinea sp. H1M3-3]|uniref:MFS transporter n=1 Tax=Chryseolinea sp. H1M3-3 TaxID=3034144 RepID=UPI0023EDF212|nr:MFS transporter [Chryseolinea sp. H1M3-3]
MLIHRIAVKIAFFINGFVFANWVSRLPLIQEIYHADNGTIGLVLLASSIGAVSAMPFTGWAIIKNGSRRITIFAALSYCAIVPLIPFMPNLVSLITLYFLMGISTGMLDVAMNAQAVMVEQIYKKPIMTSFHALFSIGMMLGAWSGSLFIDLGYDLGRHLIIVSSASLVAVWWANRNLIVDKPDPLAKHEGPLFRLPNQALISIGIITFCGMLAEGAMSDWSVNFMQNVANASVTLAPIGLSAFATAMTIGRIFGDRIRSMLGDKRMIVSGGLIACAGLSMALVAPLPWVTIAGFFLVGLGLSSIVPIAYSIAGNTKDLPPGVGLAMVTTVGYSGFLFGPPIIGFISDAFTLRIALSVVAFLLVLMTLLGLRYKSR